MANDRIRSSGRGRIRGEREPTGILPSAGSRNCTTVFIWCPLLFRVCTHLSAHAVKPRASPCSLWENCRKQTRLPSSSARPCPAVVFLLSPSFSLSPLDSELYFSRRTSKLEQAIIFLKNDFFFNLKIVAIVFNSPLVITLLHLKLLDYSEARSKILLFII